MLRPNLITKVLPIKRSPLLRPPLQLLIILAHPLKAPSQKPLNTLASRLDAGVSGAHQALAEILEAVRDVGAALDAEVEIF